jgi:hypothetical protein
VAAKLKKRTSLIATKTKRLRKRFERVRQESGCETGLAGADDPKGLKIQKLKSFGEGL